MTNYKNKPKEKLLISASFDDIIKASVSGNPVPKPRIKKKKPKQNKNK